MQLKSWIIKQILRIASPARKLHLSKELVKIVSTKNPIKNYKATQEELAMKSIRNNAK